MLAASSLVEIAVGGLVATALAVWGVLTVAQYQPRLANWATANDHLMLVPQWTFFAPIPNQSDFYFYVRMEYSGDRELTPWEEVSLARARGWYAFLWNPDRRIRKGFFDLTAELCRMTKATRENVMVSLPYLHLMAVASDLADQRGATRFQFAVARTEPAESYPDFIVLFTSEIHEVEPLEGEN